jgi:Fe-S cluster assembly protein SufD
MTLRPQTQTPTQEAAYLKAYELLQSNGFASDPAWAQTLRADAMAKFKGMGFPVTRRGNEEWKYTDIRSIATTPFRLPDSPATLELSDRRLKTAALGRLDWTRLAFVDGIYSERLSSVQSLPEGVRVVNLAEAMQSSPDIVREYLARHADYQANPFVALNTAFMHDGALVYIPDGAVVGEPIHLLFIATGKQATVSSPRVLLITGKDSSATVIESYTTLAQSRYFTNSVTEALPGPGAALRYYKVQQQSDKAFHITNTRVVMPRDASFSSVNIDLGGRLTRNNLDVLITGEGASVNLAGLYMPTGVQHVDNQVIVDHAVGHTTAKELYKGILNGKSRSIFHGSIIVRENAVKVDSMQEDKNLLLSDGAEADTKPAFWIYCDDVRCAHGAACGQIDEDVLFYLRSRGLSDTAARHLLVQGFVADIVESIKFVPLRIKIDALVKARLAKWLGAEESA